MEPLELAALLWVIESQPSEALPDLAADALVRGLDSPALRELAGARRDDFWQLKGLFEQTLDELGIETPEEQAALWRLAQHKAAEILDGSVSPSEGAHWIWWEISSQIDKEGDLRAFVGLASEWDDLPQHRTELDEEIRQAAARLVGQREPRKWLRIQARVGLAPIADPKSRAEITPSDLAVSNALSDSLTTWAQEYDALFGSDPKGFANIGDAEQFVRRGQELVDRLQEELGDAWHVEYYREPTQPPGVRLRRARWRWRARS